MPVDPRLNCAAEICCSPPPPVAGASSYNLPAHDSRVKILVGLGVPVDLAEEVSKKMVSQGLVFLSAQLAFAIREIAFPDKT